MFLSCWIEVTKHWPKSSCYWLFFRMCQNPEKVKSVVYRRFYVLTIILHLVIIDNNTSFNTSLTIILHLVVKFVYEIDFATLISCFWWSFSDKSSRWHLLMFSDFRSAHYICMQNILLKMRAIKKNSCVFDS